MTFKKPISTTEMIAHLKTKKRVIFDSDISEKESKEILLKYNYINIITPFKYRHCQKRQENPNEPEKQNGNHIYNRDVNFDEYFDAYKNERKIYPAIYTAIIEFESKFKSIVAHHIIRKYNIIDIDSYISFLEELKTRASLYATRMDNIIDDFDIMHKGANRIYNFYNHFDHLGLKTYSNIFHCLEQGFKKDIFKDLLHHRASLGITQITQFQERLFTTVSIRNCIMHGNSLEILVRYMSTRNNRLRPAGDVQKFKKVISYLKSYQPEL